MTRAESLVESDHERVMRESGHLTIRQQDESGLWCRMAYHCFREFNRYPVQWSVEVDHTEGSVSFHARSEGVSLFSMGVPRKAVSGLVEILHRLGFLPVAMHSSIKKELLFRIVHPSPDISFIEPVTESTRAEMKGFRPFREAFCYSNLVYDPEAGEFASLSNESLQRLASGWGVVKEVPHVDLSGFLEENENVFSFGEEGTSQGMEQTDLFGAYGGAGFGRIVEPPFITGFDRIVLSPRAFEHGKWRITIVYRSGGHSLKLGDLLGSLNAGRRFHIEAGCIVDLRSDGVIGVLAQAKGIGDDGTLTLSGASLMVLSPARHLLHFDGDANLKERIKNLFYGESQKSTLVPVGLHCSLRDYQHNGLAWLLFLYDNFLGGLLCDEMGLGKTVQVISLLLAIKQQRNPSATFCIVCPTSVLSHWERLFSLFAPALRTEAYCCMNRVLHPQNVNDVLLTTYGIMRNDIELLEHRTFDVVVFDEIQQLKNRSTLSFESALRLPGRLVVGLTGTPVENGLDDIRALFDIVLPGFSLELPGEKALADLFGGGRKVDAPLVRFKKRIHPFILRRLKKSVLVELPPKIEDIRYCTLSPSQSEVYRKALAQRGAPLIEKLRKSDEPVPYPHIFSLFTYLKKVCDSTALAAGKWEEYASCESGKWELFKELLDESLGSGQKVVVFTQFLGMVEMFTHYLGTIGVGCVSLTGKSRNRGEIVRRFSEDRECRVFVGSLKAGGVGIDLVSASTVIHYDRWWNAAREDQATDRVYRIGQKRGVHVFTLITENTIEERIAGIIERKRKIVEMSLEEDNPDSIKVFSREEMIELLSISPETGIQA